MANNYSLLLSFMSLKQDKNTPIFKTIKFRAFIKSSSSFKNIFMSGHLILKHWRVCFSLDFFLNFDLKAFIHKYKFIQLMGQSKSKQILNVATINFSGIIASPYQFFEKENDAEIRLNMRFVYFYELFCQHVKKEAGINSVSLPNFQDMVKQRKNASLKSSNQNSRNSKNSQNKNLQSDKNSETVLKMKKSQDNQDNAKKKSSYQKIAQKMKWCISSIDKEWQRERYCPLYTQKIGIKMNRYMQSKEEFYKSWEKVYEKNKKIPENIFISNAAKEKQKEKEKLTNQDLVSYLTTKLKMDNEKIELLRLMRKHDEKYCEQNQIKMKLNKEKWKQIYELIIYEMKVFDYLAYKAILYQIYTEGELSELEDRSFVLDAKEYRAKRNELFKKSYLNEKLKIDKTIEAIKNLQIDILFIQQATIALMKEIQIKFAKMRIVKPLQVKKNKTFSAMVINQTKFVSQDKCLHLHIQNNLFFNNRVRLDQSRNEIPKKFTAEQFKKFDINKNTVIQAIGNLILVCSHLSSKEKENYKQIKQFSMMLDRLRKQFPDAYIIAGGDLNGVCALGLKDRKKTDRRRVRDMREGDEQKKQEMKVFHQFPEISLEGLKKFDEDKKKIIDIEQPYKKIRQLPSQDEDQKNQKIKKEEDEEKEVFKAIQLKSKNITGEVKINHQTTYKKRSYIQTQSSKCDDLKLQSKDYIISNLQLFNTKVTTIDMKQDETLQNHVGIPLLPNTEHPFDHFLVRASVDLPKLIHISDQEYLKKYEPSKMTKQQLLEYSSTLRKK